MLDGYAEMPLEVSAWGLMAAAGNTGRENTALLHETLPVNSDQLLTWNAGHVASASSLVVFKKHLRKILGPVEK